MLRASVRVLLSSLFLLSFVTAASEAQYDVLIRGARFLDGAGNPWRYADLALAGHRIAAVGDLSQASAARTIDATGLYVAPGFIDAHCHFTSGGRSLTTLIFAKPNQFRRYEKKSLHASSNSLKEPPSSG